MFVAASLGVSALAADGDPVGTWNSSFTTQQGQKMESKLTVKREGGKLSGFVAGRNGNDMPIEDVKMVGDEFSFKLIRERNGEKMTAKVTAKLSGDSLNGKLDSNFGGEDHTFDWTATREKALANLTGEWKYAIDLDTGTKMKLALDLKQSGDTVTGKVRVGDFETPITEGKVSGDLVTFTIPVDTGDTKFTSRYSGSVSGDSIKGKIDSNWGGENHKYDWNATRTKTANATGTWKWSIVTKDGETIDLSLKLKQEGENITGVVVLGEDETPVTEGSIRDGTVALKITRVQDGNPETAKFQGKLEGDSIKGKIDSNWGGTPHTYDWNAKRSS